MALLINPCRPYTPEERREAQNRAPHFFDNTLTKIACAIIPIAGAIIYAFAQAFYASRHDITDNYVLKATMVKHLVDYDICILVNTLALLAISVLAIFFMPVLASLTAGLLLVAFTGVLIYKLATDCQVLNFYPKIEE